MLWRQIFDRCIQRNFMAFSHFFYFPPKKSLAADFVRRRAQGKIAPSAIDKLGLGMTSFGSTSNFSPNPGKKDTRQKAS